jgi:hypothetical protein
MSFKSLEIPEYQMELRWTTSKLFLFDQLQQKVLYQDNLKGITSIVPLADYFNQFTINFGQRNHQTLYLDLAQQMGVLTTEAGYILDFYMKSSNHGFYFGLYEMGEFHLTEEGHVRSIKTHKLKFITRGVVTKENLVYLALRESKSDYGPHKYFLALMDWKTNPPQLLWREERPSSITSIVPSKIHFILGFHNGSYELWDPIDKTTATSSPLFQKYTSFTPGIEHLLACSYAGEVGLLDYQGKPHWTSTVSTSPIHALTEDPVGIHVVDEKGEYFLLNPKTGSILQSDFWGVRIFSDLIIGRDWLLAAGERGVHGRWLHDSSATFFSRMMDPLVRKIVLHPQGFLTGDDTGKIRFWKYGKMWRH